MEENGSEGSKITEPHLNACVYKNLENLIPPSRYDFIQIHADGALLVGCSNLTERHWTGSVRISSTVQALSVVIDDNKDANKSTIQLPSGVTDGIFVGTSKKVILTEDSGALSIWNKSESGEWASFWSKEKEAEEHDGSILALACLQPQLTYVSVGDDALIKIWDIEDLMCVRTIRYNKSSINDVSVSVDSTSVFVTAALDGAVSLWDQHCDNRVQVLHQADCEVRCVRWLDDQRVVVGEEGGRLVQLDVRRADKPLSTLIRRHPHHRITIQHDTNRIAVCGDSSVVEVFCCSPASQLTSLFTNKTHKDFVRGSAWDSYEQDTLHTVSWDTTLLSHTIPQA